MELSRRDAVAALAVLGAGGAVGATLRRRSSADGAHRRRTMVAAAEVVYPEDLEGIEAFVETFLAGRLESQAHAAGLEEAVSELDRFAEGYHDAPFADLSRAERDATLRTVGADDAAEHPHGTAAERIRYYVVNDLLLALYASPTGGELVGIENPRGYAGGLDTYRRGPGA